MQDYSIEIKLVKTFDIGANQRMLLLFLNNNLRQALRRLEFTEIGRSGKFFNSRNKQKLDALFMFSGFKINYVVLEKGLFLRVDPAKKIVRQDTALETIKKVYRDNQGKDKEVRRQLVKEALIGSIVLSNYGKPAYYKITDIEFIKPEEVTFPQEGN